MKGGLKRIGDCGWGLVEVGMEGVKDREAEGGEGRGVGGGKMGERA